MDSFRLSQTSWIGSGFWNSYWLMGSDETHFDSVKTLQTVSKHLQTVLRLTQFLYDSLKPIQTFLGFVIFIRPRVNSVSSLFNWKLYSFWKQGLKTFFFYVSKVKMPIKNLGEAPQFGRLHINPFDSHSNFIETSLQSIYS